MAKDQLKALGDLAGELNQKASIPFRVYAVLGETDDEASPKVVIFQSGQLRTRRPAGRRRTPKATRRANDPTTRAEAMSRHRRAKLPLPELAELSLPTC